MSHLIIRNLFEGRLAAWAANQSLRVAYQNVQFDPENGETYLRAFTLPAGIDSNTLAGDHRLYTGVFQVTIVTPAGNGPGSGEALADQLAAVFPLNDALVQGALTVLIMTPISPGPEQQDDDGYALPVSFEYRSDTN